MIGWTRMWESYLQGDLFTANALLTFGTLLTFDVDRGIDDAWWGPTPGTNADDDTPDAHTNPDVNAALAAIGVDQDDLLSLLVETPEPASSPGKAPAHASPRPGSRNRRRND